MYYEFPKEDMAYAGDMHGAFAQYFFCSADIFAAPVVNQSTVVSPSAQYVTARHSTSYSVWQRSPFSKWCPKIELT